MKNRALHFLELPLPKPQRIRKPLVPTVLLAFTILTGEGFWQTIQQARAG